MDAPVQMSRSVTTSQESEEERRDRFMSYECCYAACKYDKHTWRQIKEEDYEHFKSLLTNNVDRDSNTFKTLIQELTEKERIIAMDTPWTPQTQPDLERYLDIVCGHNGRMKGKTWGHILKNHYDYFMWSVGNAMGRETRTFNAFITCLKDEDQLYVLSTPKGTVVTKKGKRGVSLVSTK